MDRQDTSQYNEILPMHNILTYIIYSNHHSFLNTLINYMIENVWESYSNFSMLKAQLNCLKTIVQQKECIYAHKVVLFFFFLTIDKKMRHWILSSQLSNEHKEMQDKLLRKNISLTPKYQSTKNVKNPFLGQSVVFNSLNPHAATSIFMEISREEFFEPIFNTGGENAMFDTYSKLKHLVLLA